MAFIELGANPAGEYETLIRTVGNKTGVEPELVAAHIMAESAFNSRAFNPEGSYGLMQIYLPTAKKLLNLPDLKVESLYVPEINLMSGVLLIRQNLNRYENNLPDAIAAYNAGMARKNAYGQYTDSKGNIRVQNYVDRVLDYYRTYKTGYPLTAIALSKVVLAVPLMLLAGLAIFTLIRRRG